MPFKPGDEAVVLSLNRRGRVIEVLGRRYRVSVGSLTAVVRETDLKLPDAGKKKGKRRRDSGAGGGERQADAEGPTRRVDLHGMTREAAREAVVAAVNAAVLEGASVLEVVHGIGTGRVREAAWQELKRLSVVRHVSPHPTNRGVTLAHL